MVMERGDRDLHQVLNAYRYPYPTYMVLRVWHQMLLAVAYIHRNGVIHSDLKPGNFLLVGGRLKLIDFGIASNIATEATSIIKYTQGGTFNYVSPEALTDTSQAPSPPPANGRPSANHPAHQPHVKISTKSDVWSLGCILYQLLYRDTPFGHIKNTNMKMVSIVNDMHAIAYRALPPTVPGLFLEIVQRCLVRAPKQRASVQELLEEPYDVVRPFDDLGLISDGEVQPSR